ncbi:MAG: 1-phosphofructokinase [Ruminococcaceae bacterium]|jgi:1-phosphofructokinase|nr:1-phosphofructokinase [Oscillospiraceae bacterium]
MIYTVTFNPSVDYYIKSESFNLGEINRTRDEQLFVGGKGINVSLVLKRLGVESVASGFTAGETGSLIEGELRKNGIKTDFVRVKNGFSRINIKLTTDTQTQLNGSGPSVSRIELQRFYSKLEALSAGDILVLSGSVPGSMPQNTYEKILEYLSGRGVLSVVDAEGKLLTNTLKFKPFLIKPNREELEEIFSKKMLTDDEIIKAASRLQKKGARNVLVSLDEDGALLLDETGKIHRQGTRSGTVINPVGAGDSMIAGFIAGYLKKKDYEYALRLGTAAGTATAFSRSLASKTAIEKQML